MMMLILTTAMLSDLSVNLMITREVRGAVYPLNRWNTPCSSDDLNATPCNCYGGASRRHAVLTSTDAVTIDTGSYFSGSGLYFPVHRGNVSAEYFAASGYRAWTLSYRDFSAFATASEPTGGQGLRAYIDRVRTSNLSVPAPIVSNLNTTDDPFLAEALVTRADLTPPGQISPYGLVALPDGRTMGVLAFLDPTHLFALSPHYAARTLPFDRAMAAGLAALARLPGGPPDVTIAIVTAIPVDGTFGDDLIASHGGSTAAQAAFVRDLIRPATGLDVVVLGMGGWTNGPTVERNWAGDDVLVLPERRNYGVGVETVTVVTGDDGRLREGSTSVATAGELSLTCDTPEDQVVAAGLAARQVALDEALQGVVGYVTSPLALDTRAAPFDSYDPPPSWGSCTLLSGSGGGAATTVCGCRVSDCPQGALAADAQRFATGAQLALVNGGALRLAELPAGAVSMAELVSLLPFLNEVVVVEASGHQIRAALSHAISRLASSDAASSPSGAFMQLAATLRFEWFFEEGVPTLGTVEVRAAPTAEDGTAAAAMLGASGEAYGAWRPLDDEAGYTVALSEYIADGGDGFTQFQQLERTYPGFTQSAAVNAYLAHFGEASPLPAPPAARITQTPDLLHLPLGLLCKALPSGPGVGAVSQREECDHARFMVDVLNDKTDGLFDDLLPSAVIVLNESHVGCVQGLVEGALAQLRDAPNLAALGTHLHAHLPVIGPSCSSDVAEVASADARAASGWQGVSISPSSTAPLLSDGDAYPNLVRLSSNELTVATGLASLVDHFNWQRVAVLHDDSVWGKASAHAFMSAFKERVPEGDLLNCAELDEITGACAVSLAGVALGETRDTQFSLADVEAHDDDLTTYCVECIVSLLRTLEEQGARVIVLATQPRVAGQIMYQVHETQLLSGAGYAWMLTWVSEDMLRNPHDGNLNTSIIYGAEGVIGVTEMVDTTTSTYAAYTERWAQHSSTAACTEAGSASYCDADGDPATLPGYSAFNADSVLAYAAAMHSVYRSAPSDAAALHAALVTLGSTGAMPTGVSGELVLDASSGDRRGRITVQNLQIIHQQDNVHRRHLGLSGSMAGDDDPRLTTATAQRWWRRLYVPFESSGADLVNVGTLDSDGAISFGSDSTIYFPGRVTAVPSDSPSNAGNGVRLVLLVGLPIVAGVAAVLLAAFLLYRRRARQQLKTLQQELERFKDSIVGARAVLLDFDPRSLEPPQQRHQPSQPADEIASAAEESLAASESAGSGHARGSSTSSAVGAQVGRLAARRQSAQPKARWYWQEDKDRVYKHNQWDVFGETWVAYSGSVSRELEEAYQTWRGKGARGSKKPPRTANGSHLLDLTDRIQSTNTEEKAFAQDSGVMFAVNFADMRQRNVKTGYERPMLRREEKAPAPAPPAPIELEAAAAVLPTVNVAAPVAAQQGTLRLSTAARMVSLSRTLQAQAAAQLQQRPPSNGASATSLTAQAGDGAPPADLAGEDFLLLRQGQLVQTSRQRADGWAYGSVILDEMNDRPPLNQNGVSTDAGWFPLRMTGHPTPAQLEQLQSQMGGVGAGAALQPPQTWGKVKDPLTAELIPLPEGPEKQAVVGAFSSTLPPGVRVVGVERVQNVSMWQSYAVKRQTVLQREKKSASSLSGAAPKESRFERKWLYHGCQDEVVPKIVQQGFNRSFCGRNATAYGKGVYFARDASYSSGSTCSPAASWSASSAPARGTRSRPTCGRGTSCTTRPSTPSTTPPSSSCTTTRRRTLNT